MRHFLVAAMTSSGITHFLVAGGSPEQSQETLLALLAKGTQVTDEVGRVYGSWEIDATSVRIESRPPQSSGDYGPFRIDGQRIRETRS